jgi:hypothetical protein
MNDEQTLSGVYRVMLRRLMLYAVVRNRRTEFKTLCTHPVGLVSSAYLPNPECTRVIYACISSTIDISLVLKYKATFPTC